MHYPLTEVRLHFKDGRSQCWTCELAPGTQLQDFIVSQGFLSNTNINPHSIEFQVNGVSAEDDYLLMPGDSIVGIIESRYKARTSESTIAIDIRINTSNYYKFQIASGTSLGEFALSRQFIEVTTAHPRTLAFKVREDHVDDNYILMHGDRIMASLKCMEKGSISARETIKRLERLVGLRWCREGGNHAIWKTTEGHVVAIPRHARDLRAGTLRKILKDAGIRMGLEEFLSLRP